VGTARDGWEALRAIKSHPWDLAIVDLDLPPVMDLALTGWDLVRILRAYDGRVAVLVVSAEEGPAVREKLVELRVNGFLGKPIRLGQLRVAIRSLGDSPIPVGTPGDPAWGFLDQPGCRGTYPPADR
jgi:CheY-like chemotaxis protein